LAASLIVYPQGDVNPNVSDSETLAAYRTR
jgi:hypothetical protein